MACFEKKISLSRCRLRQGLVSLFHIHTIVKKKGQKDMLYGGFSYDYNY